MKFEAAELKKFSAAVLKDAGLTAEEAEVFADALIEANLRGVDSHGITRLGVYTRRIEAGLIKPGAELTVIKETPASFAFDANDGVGAVMGRRMADRCMEKAKQSGVCVAVAKNGTHWGVASFYTKYIAEKGMIGFAFCNSEAAVVPFGGAKPMLGTNPLSTAIPGKEHAPFVLDMATSVVARGKVVQAKKEGRQIPGNWCVDANGNPTTDPEAALGGYMLPFGGPKGYGISLIIDMLSSGLSGALDCRKTNHFWDDFEHPQNVGYFMCVIDPKAFLPEEEFEGRIDRIMDEMKACPPAPGFSEVLIPGEMEDRTSAKRSAEGIELADSLVGELKKIGEARNIAFPEEK